MHVNQRFYFESGGFLTVNCSVSLVCFTFSLSPHRPRLPRPADGQHEHCVSEQSDGCADYSPPLHLSVERALGVQLPSLRPLHHIGALQLQFSSEFLNTIQK